MTTLEVNIVGIVDGSMIQIRDKENMQYDPSTRILMPRDLRSLVPDRYKIDSIHKFEMIVFGKAILYLDLVEWKDTPEFTNYMKSGQIQNINALLISGLINTHKNWVGLIAETESQLETYCMYKLSQTNKDEFKKIQVN